MARIDYARVSSIDQDLTLQLAKLKAVGCSIVRAEKAAGGSRDGRPELAAFLAFLRQGDDLMRGRLAFCVKRKRPFHKPAARAILRNIM